MKLSPEPLLLALGLSSAFVAGLMATASGKRRAAIAPVVTLICFVAIGSVSLVQLAVAPQLLPLLMRDGWAQLAAQPWRLLTSLLVQDGGWAGAAFNLVGLFAIGSIAERLLGRLQWGVVAAVSVASAQWVALLWQPAGAGNSILNFGLGGALCAACLMRRVRPGFVPAIVASACFILLLAMRDIHGVAAATGALVASAFSLAKRKPGAGKAG